MRMHQAIAVATAFSLALPAAAQPWLTTSPAGFEFVEGSSDSRDLLGTEPKLRYQQVDSTIDLPVLGINRIGFRRDGQQVTNPQYQGRTVELELVMAESDIWTFNAAFAANYAANQAVVLTRKQVSFPDWTQRPAGLPAPTDLVVPLDTPWNYPGRKANCRDLLWEMRIHGNTSAGAEYPFDLAFVGAPNVTFGNAPPPAESVGTSISTGCRTPGSPAPFDLRETVKNHRTKFEIESIALNGVPRNPVTLFLSAQPTNINHPNLCAAVRVLPDVIIPHGVTSPGRVVRLIIDPIPHNKAFIGASLYMQAITPDASQPGWPIAVSSAHTVTIPADPEGPGAGRIWAKDPTAATATAGPVAGAVIVHLGR